MQTQGSLLGHRDSIPMECSRSFLTCGSWWIYPLHPLYPCFLYSSMPVRSLEPEVQDQIRKKDPWLETVYFNKGL